MAASHDAFLDLLEQGWVATGKAVREEASSDSDELDRLAGVVDRHPDSLEPAAHFDVDALRADVRRDRDLLRAFAAEADTVEADKEPKLTAVVEELAAIGRGDQGDHRRGDRPPQLDKFADGRTSVTARPSAGSCAVCTTSWARMRVWTCETIDGQIEAKFPVPAPRRKTPRLDESLPSLPS